MLDLDGDPVRSHPFGTLFEVLPRLQASLPPRFYFVTYVTLGTVRVLSAHESYVCRDFFSLKSELILFV